MTWYKTQKSMAKKIIFQLHKNIIDIEIKIKLLLGIEDNLTHSIWNSEVSKG